MSLLRGAKLKTRVTVTFHGDQTHETEFAKGSWQYEAICRIATNQDGLIETPSSNGVKRVWHGLPNDKYRRLLKTLVRTPDGRMRQSDVLAVLGLSSHEVRGLVGGLTKMCRTEGIDPIVWSEGYGLRRLYMIGPVAATTIRTLL